MYALFPFCIQLFQILGEEGRELVERNQVHPVVEVDVARAGNDEQFLRLAGELVGLLAELSGMRVVARDEQHRTRRDRLDVVERVEVHELHVAAERRMRRQLRRLPSGVNSPRGVR